MNKLNKILAVLAGIIAVILSILIYIEYGLFGKSKDVDLAKAISLAVQEEDIDSLFKLYDNIYSKAMASEYDMDKEEYKSDIETEYIEDIRNTISEDVGTILSIDCNVDEVFPYTGNDLTDAKEGMKADCDISISSAEEIYMTWAVKGEKDTKDYAMVAWVYKRGGRWYLLQFDFDK